MQLDENMWSLIGKYNRDLGNPETSLSRYPLYQPLIVTSKIGIELCVYGKYKHFSRRKNDSPYCQL